MKLYIIRHGETKWNVERRLQGASDTDLNEKGIALAKVTGEALKEVPFFCCFTSPLKRAKETARLVLGEKEIPVYLDERIQEISFGTWEGRDSVLLPGNMLDNFFHHTEQYEAPEGERKSLRFVPEPKRFGRILPPGKNFRIKLSSLHPMDAQFVGFYRMCTRMPELKISGMAVFRQTAASMLWK